MRFFYLRNKKNLPVVCVATLRMSDAVFIGVSTYNPHDKFDRHYAMSHAAMNLSEKSKSFQSKGFSVPMKVRIVNHIANSLEYPNRAREVARAWLKSRIVGGDFINSKIPSSGVTSNIVEPRRFFRGLEAPRGYLFTTEFRVPRNKEFYFINDSLGVGQSICDTHTDKFLIMVPIVETKEFDGLTDAHQSVLKKLYSPGVN